MSKETVIYLPVAKDIDEHIENACLYGRSVISSEDCLKAQKDKNDQARRMLDAMMNPFSVVGK